MASTKEVYDAHYKSFFAGDVDGLIDYYTDDSVIVTDQGVVTGLSGIRTFFGQSLQTRSSLDTDAFTLH